ncbi:MAG: beta-galactosidase [Clostridia bacterium]|nr:beta-galactosidase [Clostridia bacterium]
MKENFYEHIIHGGDYNPDQWIKTPEIWDEDMRLMNLAHINSATVGIFSWSAVEPEEGVYNFEWLDRVLDNLHENGKYVILATPSGARPAWLAQKYPEVLRVNEEGVRNEYGVRHNHCLTSPLYREKVRNINRIIAERYKNHPAVKMWHISNEYCGECHCELCQNAFRQWLREHYNNDIELLNDKWWNRFWSHQLNDFSQITSPKSRGENHVVGLKLAWKRFVSDQTISFFENEIAPLREITPDIPVTTNFMWLFDGLDLQEFAKHVDIVSWDNYPEWNVGKDTRTAVVSAFVHDVFRSMKGGKPFLMMESTPSVINWRSVNKIPEPGMLAMSSVQAVAHGADSVQYFQWRKSRGGHEKFHGAVVDHCGHENTRVFREVTALGKDLEKLDGVINRKCESRVAIVYDWQNEWVTNMFCGYNNARRDYQKECIKWYEPFWKRGISVDMISMDSDFSHYDAVIAPFLYMLKDGTAERIEKYVNGGGSFVATYLTGIADEDDLCFLGGFPGNGLGKVFGVWAEETDALPENCCVNASFDGKTYEVNHVCDIIHAQGAQVLGTYESEFYKGEPSVTCNGYGKGKAYYVAFRNDGELAGDFCDKLIKELEILPDADIDVPHGVSMRKRGSYIFVINFTDDEKQIKLNGTYRDVLTGEELNNTVMLNKYGYMVLE